MILTQNWEEANLALNNGSTRLEPKQGRSSDVAPVDSSTLWYKARGYQHHLMTTATMMMTMTMLPVDASALRHKASGYEHHLGNNALIREGEIMDTLLTQLSTDADKSMNLF